MTFSKKFLQGRERHLEAKMRYTRDALAHIDLPDKHAEYKIHKHIPDIDAALTRLKLNPDSYGFCTLCKKPIPKKRLLKHPHVGHCVPCEEELEKNK